MNANASSLTLSGVATLNADSIYFEQTMPAEFGTAAVGPAAGRQSLALAILSGPQDIEQRVRLTLSCRRQWRLDVMDIQGRRVARVMDEVAGPGRREVRWSRIAVRQSVGPGVYFYRLSGDGVQLTSKFILLQ